MVEHDSTAAPARADPGLSSPASETAAAAVVGQVALPQSPPAEPTLTASELQAALERERWLRDRFDREHQATLALMRLLLAGLTSEGRLVRLWRWLIDDFRSERRMAAIPNRETSEERVLLRKLLAWFNEHGFAGNRDGSGEQAQRGGQ